MKKLLSILVLLGIVFSSIVASNSFIPSFPSMFKSEGARQQKYDLIFPVDLGDLTIINKRVQLTGWFKEGRWYGRHRAYDVSVVENTPVVMPANGVIKAIHTYSYPRLIENGWISGLGIYLDVEFMYRGRKIMMRFAHLNKISDGLFEGKPINQGQVIASTGSTGLVNKRGITVYAPHLHFEVFENGIKIPFARELGEYVKSKLNNENDPYAFTLRRAPIGY